MKGVYFIIFLCFFKVAISEKDVKETCIIQYLKEQGRLDEDFPSPTKAVESCAMIIPFILPIMKDRFATKMSEITSECFSTQLKTDGLVDYLMKEEIFENLTEFSAQEVKKELADTRQMIEGILNYAAEVCESEISNKVIHDKYLIIKNETRAITRYCLSKFVIDAGIIDAGNLDINPSNIDTTKIECESGLNAVRINAEKLVKKEYKEQNIPQRRINCALREYRRNKMFENSIAMGALQNLDMSPEIKKRNEENIQANVESFSRGIIGCFMRK
ncbi:CLUMA_CG005980, isoform A [Clunio marinus]|uniref:CLUMA_CG005980, isoform A n=1 Tax=Clunio marinus TaxID=568069 RepID=A0A1J1HWD7_9DIPT|nr:CLUMA_CG005980, isoform A [Clunio marinus]